MKVKCLCFVIAALLLAGLFVSCERNGRRTIYDLGHVIKTEQNELVFKEIVPIEEEDRIDATIRLRVPHSGSEFLIVEKNRRPLEESELQPYRAILRQYADSARTRGDVKTAEQFTRYANLPSGWKSGSLVE